ncbi:MAG: transposase [Actinobacteria bacterium]|nr:transposase [Actinomycetota bacterium]MBW3651940.1 transposase [Actinomycetota bacterium]
MEGGFDLPPPGRTPTVRGRGVPSGGSPHATSHPSEFCRRAVELARQHAKPVAELARDLGISESCLRNWMAKANVDEGHREGTTSEERVELRRKLRVAELEIEIFRLPRRVGRGQGRS